MVVDAVELRQELGAGDDEIARVAQAHDLGAAEAGVGDGQVEAGVAPGELLDRDAGVQVGLARAGRRGGGIDAAGADRQCHLPERVDAAVDHKVLHEHVEGLVRRPARLDAVCVLLMMSTSLLTDS